MSGVQSFGCCVGLRKVRPLADRATATSNPQDLTPPLPDTPSISVLLAVRNGMPYLGHAIRSILAQDCRDFEFVIIDDGSTDETAQRAQGLDDERIRYYRLERVGFCTALNFGLQRARGGLLARMDADDVACPSRLGLQRQHMSEHPRCVVVGCQADEIDAEGQTIGERLFPVSDSAIRWRMFFGCPFLHPGTMSRTELVRACGGYDTTYPCAQDYRLWVELSRHGTLANLAEKLMLYRLHPKSVTAVRTEQQVEFCGEIAAEYAARLCAGIDRDAVAELWHFRAEGRDPVRSSYDDLVAAHRTIRDYVLQHVETNDELLRRMAVVRQELRWCCTERAERSWRRPWHAWRWLRLAGRFDPEDGRLDKIVRRCAARMLRIR